MKNAIKVFGYVLLAIFFATQLLGAIVSPMPKALIPIGIMLAIGLWAGNKFKNRGAKANSED